MVGLAPPSKSPERNSPVSSDPTTFASSCRRVSGQSRPEAVVARSTVGLLFFFSFPAGRAVLKPPPSSSFFGHRSTGGGYSISPEVSTLHPAGSFYHNPPLVAWLCVSRHVARWWGCWFAEAMVKSPLEGWLLFIGTRRPEAGRWIFFDLFLYNQPVTTPRVGQPWEAHGMSLSWEQSPPISPFY